MLCTRAFKSIGGIRNIQPSRLEVLRGGALAAGTKSAPCQRLVAPISSTAPCLQSKSKKAQKRAVAARARAKQNKKADEDTTDHVKGSSENQKLQPTMSDEGATNKLKKRGREMQPTQKKEVAPPVIKLCVQKGPPKWNKSRLLGWLRMMRAFLHLFSSVAEAMRANAERAGQALPQEVEDAKKLASQMQKLLLRAKGRLEVFATGSINAGAPAAVVKDYLEAALAQSIASNPRYTITLQGPSMLPTIDTADKPVKAFCIPQTHHSVQNVERGQICTFITSYKSKTLLAHRISCPIANPLCKRIVALGGDVVAYKGNKFTVPKGYCWALGDNPSESFDSREFGAVPLINLRQRVLFTYSLFPPSFKRVV